MLARRLQVLLKPLSNGNHQLRRIAAESTHNQLTHRPNLPNPITPINQSTLLKVCTILFQQQNSPDSRLHSSLSSSNASINPEFFLQVCNNFPYSWRPVYRFFLYTQKLPQFTHNSLTFNKMLDVIGKARNIDLFWETCQEMGFEPEVEAVETMMETLFKTNKYEEAMKVFQMMRVNRMDDLGVSTYRLVIKWMCKRGKIEQANGMFDEMSQRGIEADNLTMASIIYGLLARGRVREAYRIAEGIKNPDISIYHGLIKGLLRQRKTSEATQVFREMIKRGCEPIMHTYIMLLQGHLGKRGRKGHDPLVNFDTIFVGGLVKAGKSLEATKYVERTLKGGMEVPRFDYNKFLHYYSNEEGVAMFEDVGKKLREVGLFDLADILERYGQKMATRDRRRDRWGPIDVQSH
ncbi:hypothetical protein COLO4_27901 [Corchorus olitorius]|uniref:Pentacotripeptide-repeat region of PRORP domain-containing protein n=1 Tax=Corchorus olitorius TaxID=93759 RepID=A0A1R3HP75_9ROSI|nr:hypothetical protein COLO4_27901 [Corchorus olitorius]